MKITRLRATPVNIPLEAPYLWSYGALDGFSKCIVEVETNEGTAVSCSLLPPGEGGRRPDEGSVGSGISTTIAPSSCPSPGREKGRSPFASPIKAIPLRPCHAHHHLLDGGPTA